ncbi:TolC family protein [Echinicola marina]|uniref:TolC family protein n=1 Tax=Echinicola marina TaxID=2859768 RepID=UPI001CF709D5|nr:TolC family protein [Echinicola marina]UCS91901.1 TolC family protein [Echinicola marina]
MRFFITLTVIVFNVLDAWSQGNVSNLSLEECVQIGLENNLELQRSVLNQENNQANLMEAKGQRYPSLSMTSSYNYSWGRALDNVTNDYLPSSSFGSAGFSVRSNVSLFSGGRINNSINQAAVDLETGELNVEATKNNITLNIVNLFVNVVFAKEQVNVAKSQLEVTSNQLERTRKLVEVGALPISDQYDLEAQNATSNMELTNAQNNLRLAKLNLMQAIQIPYEEEFDVSVPDLEAENYLIGEHSVNEVYAIALALMPEVKAAQLGIESAEYGVKMAKGAYYPTLGFGANASTNFNELYKDVVPFWEQFDGNLSEVIGVNLNIPIFSNLSNKANLQRAKVQKKLSKINVKEVQNRLRQDIETAYTNALSAKQSYESSLLRVSSLNEAFRMAQKRFEVGMINAVDFQVAQNNLFNAQADLLQAKYQYIFSVKVLDFYVGNPLTL